MIAILNVHHSQSSFLEYSDRLVTTPPVSIENYRDSFGNWCCRLVAPAGLFTLGTDTVIQDDGKPDPQEEELAQHPVEDLPPETLLYLLGSRYCETDCLSEEAWRLFASSTPGWRRVQEICDFVHEHVKFGYEHSSPTRTALAAYEEAVGVCRDFTHLAITFCRCMNIPARYCTGYVTDIGQPLPYEPMDFAAWMEVYLGGRWCIFDPRNNSPRVGRVLIARGRDAADVPLTHTFGKHEITSFKVWAEQVTDG